MADPVRYTLTKGNRQIDVEIGPDGRTELVACCLKTDSWEDYLAFKAQAAEAVDRGDRKGARRNLRAALVSLFSHVEGVVHEIYGAHKIARTYPGESLSARIGNIACQAAQKVTVPRPNFRLGKYLRDIVAHPGIEKTFCEAGSQTVLTECTLYEFLDLATVEQLEGAITPWLAAVCTAFVVQRFPGENEVDTFVEGLREGSPDAIVEWKSKTERSVDLLPFLEIKVIDDETNRNDK